MRAFLRSYNFPFLLGILYAELAGRYVPDAVQALGHPSSWYGFVVTAPMTGSFAWGLWCLWRRERGGAL